MKSVDPGDYLEVEPIIYLEGFSKTNVLIPLQLDQGNELEDMVKYLELEQQFSTKKAKISKLSAVLVVV